tara:strand:- start:706 stop:1053 length:348 start_codon:yes stop_codon:yes gene_type:complete
MTNFKREMFEPVIYSKNILDYKEQLTSPKTGDKFAVDINLKNGHRVYNISIGRKYIYFKELFNISVIKKSVAEGRKILDKHYWDSAKWDWFQKNCTLKAGDKRKKSIYKNWKKDY